MFCSLNPSNESYFHERWIMNKILSNNVVDNIAFCFIFGAVFIAYGIIGVAEASRLQSVPGASCALFSPKSVSSFHITYGYFYCEDSSPSGSCFLNCPIIFYSNLHELKFVDLDYEVIGLGNVTAKVCGRNWDNTLMKCTKSQSRSGKGYIRFSDFSMFGDLNLYSRFWVDVSVPDSGKVIQYDITWED